MKPGEHKTLQSRILHYTQEIGWAYVSLDEVERWRGFTPHPNPLPQGERENTDEARKAALFFGDLIDQIMMTQLCVHAR